MIAKNFEPNTITAKKNPTATIKLIRQHITYQIANLYLCCVISYANIAIIYNY
jgi:hypothetical protein